MQFTCILCFYGTSHFRQKSKEKGRVFRTKYVFIQLVAGDLPTTQHIKHQLNYGADDQTGCREATGARTEAGAEARPWQCCPGANNWRCLLTCINNSGSRRSWRHLTNSSQRGPERERVAMAVVLGARRSEVQENNNKRWKTNNNSLEEIWRKSQQATATAANSHKLSSGRVRILVCHCLPARIGCQRQQEEGHILAGAGADCKVCETKTRLARSHT